MGTYAIVSIINNKIEKHHYCLHDGYPDYVGKNILNFLCNHSIDDIAKFHSGILLKNECDFFDKEKDYEYCLSKGWYEGKYDNINTGNSKNVKYKKSLKAIDWHWALQKAEGDIEAQYNAFLQDGFVYVYTGDIAEEFCYKYVVDLDNGIFEYNPYNKGSISFSLKDICNITDVQEKERIVNLYINLFNNF